MEELCAEDGRDVLVVAVAGGVELADVLRAPKLDDGC